MKKGYFNYTFYLPDIDNVNNNVIIHLITRHN